MCREEPDDLIGEKKWPLRCLFCREWDHNCDCLFCPECGGLVERDAAYHAARVAPALRFCSAECLRSFAEGMAGAAGGSLELRIDYEGRVRLEQAR